MGSLDLTDWILFTVAALAAVFALTGLMRNRREQVRRQIARELQQQQERESTDSRENR